MVFTDVTAATIDPMKTNVFLRCTVNYAETYDVSVATVGSGDAVESW